MQELETTKYFSCVVTIEFSFFFTTSGSNSGPQSNVGGSTFFIFNPSYKVIPPRKRSKWQRTEWKNPHNHSQIFFVVVLKYLFIYSWETQREAERQVDGEAGSLWGARHGTRSQDPGIRPWAKGRRSTTEPPRRPKVLGLNKSFCFVFKVCI